jgi:hypothetical protein
MNLTARHVFGNLCHQQHSGARELIDTDDIDPESIIINQYQSIDQYK